MKLTDLSTCVILIVLLASLLAGCGTPAATSTPTPVMATLTPFLTTVTLTPVPPAATLTPFSPTDTPAPAAAAAGVIASSRERISAPDVPKSDRRTLSAGNNTFAFDLYQAIGDGEDNFLYSPYSLSVALAMIYAGARGQTEQQMAETLHFELPQELLHPAFNALDLELASRSHVNVRDASDDEVEQVAFQLNIANAVWGQTGYPFLPAYLDSLALNYGAGIRLVDFEENAPAAVKAINRWISEETEGRIRDVVRDLPETTRLVLSNAVYFNAQWDQPFDQDRTRDEPFHLLGGGQENVPLMHQQDEFGYTEGDGYQAIQLPYLNRQMAMVVLLPAEGRFREIEEWLAGNWVQEVVSGFAEHEVILTMPKFRFETPVLSLKETLRTMGMPDAFSPDDADFSDITEPHSGPSLYIEDVLHKAFIDVNERRTEAAAATVVKAPPGMTREELTKPPPIVMKIDRPFVFLIRDIETNTILFVGRVMNPASE